ncbi:uncharacterized protein LOC110943115 [Helianthus annuus]|uniref:uncharacterized protein LOC110943115 n=1 Tax=Helianthus annuus TaxID=4232 RepID=UPI000B8FE82E|nr:uncharacterized protein LOC110943115 [Helianthus annuus]
MQSVFSDGGIFVWNNWAPPKANYLGWRAGLGRVADKVSLRKKGIFVFDMNCNRCGLAEESCNHIFARCIWARSVWWNVFHWLKIPVLCDANDVAEILKHVQTQVDSKKWKKVVHLVALGCIWRIWLARNDKEYNGKMIPVHRLVETIKEESFG